MATSWPPLNGGTWVIDLDGVVWLAGQEIVGSADAVARLRGAGVGVLFATNNSALARQDLIQRLERIGIPAETGDIASSAQAAAALIEPGSRVLPVAERGVLEALAERGATVVDQEPADAVVVGWTRAFDFDRLATAARAVRAGARLYGTNDDATFPTPTGLLPGAGSLLAAVAKASGAVPVVAGKPNDPMVRLVREKAGRPVAVVGDRPATDGEFAERLGVPFGLVLSGVTTDAQPATEGGSPAGGPAAIASNLGELVARALP